MISRNKCWLALVTATMFVTGCATTSSKPSAPYNSEVNQFYPGGNPAMWWYYP